MWIVFRHLLFCLDAEKAHHLTMGLLSMVLKIPILNSLIIKSFCFEDKNLQIEVCGLKARNPVGLAAGFDKDGKWLQVLSAIGFGHIEVGTVTPLAQTGNPKPRLFRLVKDQSIINRMGFNNAGAEALANRLKKFAKPDGLIIGGNIGKNKSTPPELAIQDYLACFRILFDYIDYFAINVSSPNTPGLRQLQDKEPLDNLLTALQNENRKHHKQKPLFLKIASDLEAPALDDILDVVIKNRFSGIIVSNTTLDRPENLQDKKTAAESGGLSGAILTDKANHVLKYLHSKSKDQLIYIGVGGIMDPEDAKERIQSGATWIQLYAGFIYNGPWLIKKINKELVHLKKQQAEN